MAVGYTTISDLLKIESARHLINLSVDRSGALITDADVIATLNSIINDASREFDGYVLGHAPVPWDDYADVPPSVEVLVRGYAVFLLWARRGRQDQDNPHNWRFKYFMDRVRDIQRGLWKFDLISGETVAPKPVKYEEDRVAGEADRIKSGRRMTDTSLKEFREPIP